MKERYIQTSKDEEPEQARSQVVQKLIDTISNQRLTTRPDSSEERVALSGEHGCSDRLAGAGPGFDPRSGLFFVYMHSLH